MEARSQMIDRRAATTFAAVVAIFAATSASAVTLGPRAEDPPPRAAEERPALDVPPLRLAIPVLATGVPRSEEEQFKKRIWPELRNAESVRIAVKLKEAIDARRTFQDVVVTPDASVSADFYLLGRIAASNAEDLEVRWSLVDATQTYQIPRCSGGKACRRTDKYRLWDGWHDVNDSAQKDPFGPFYAEIADRIHRKIAELAAQHAKQAARNRRQAAAGRRTKLSTIDAIVNTRSLVFAAYFAPDLYGDAVKERRGRLTLDYLPTQEGDDWARVESIRARDERFAVLLSENYASFVADMHDPYSQWQKDNFPFARDARLARREATLSAVAGAIGAAGAVAAAADEGNPNSKGIATVLGAGAAAAIVNSVHERRKASAMHDRINELGASVQGALKPVVVATRERTVTLSGTAREQFQQWRALMREMYANTANDIEAVQFADAGED